MQGYASSAQTPYALDNLRWVGDYIMKLHYSDVEFCAQARRHPHAAVHAKQQFWPSHAADAGTAQTVH